MLGFLKDIAGAAVSGIGNVVGSVLTNKANAAATRETNEANAREAEKNRQFQLEQSNTAYQRAMVDMKKAGLNPMLAYSQGGASTPSGSMATNSAPQIENVLSKGINSAVEARRLKKELDATDSQVGLNKAIEMTQKAQTKLNENSAKVADVNAKAMEAQLPAIRQTAKFEEKRDKINEKYVGVDALMNRTGQATGIINNAVSTFKPAFNLNGWKSGSRPGRGDMLINKKGEILRDF